MYNTGLPGPDRPKMPNPSSKYAKYLQKYAKQPKTGGFELPG